VRRHNGRQSNRFNGFHPEPKTVSFIQRLKRWLYKQNPPAARQAGSCAIWGFQPKTQYHSLEQLGTVTETLSSAEPNLGLAPVTCEALLETVATGMEKGQAAGILVQNAI
jgi:hypothetical protein